VLDESTVVVSVEMSVDSVEVGTPIVELAPVDISVVPSVD
jgi:hypothetical protein